MGAAAGIVSSIGIIAAFPWVIEWAIHSFFRKSFSTLSIDAPQCIHPEKRASEEAVGIAAGTPYGAAFAQHMPTSDYAPVVCPCSEGCLMPTPFEHVTLFFVSRSGFPDVRAAYRCPQCGRVSMGEDLADTTKNFKKKEER